MEPRKRIILALWFVLFFLAVGTTGYAVIDGYSVIDAFYMTVITISTVGFGEVNVLSSTGRVFTIFLIMSGVGSIAFAAGAFTEILIERAANPHSWIKAMEKRIERLENHVIICGFGRVGAAAAEYFKKNGTDFVVIERSEEHESRLSEMDILFLFGDGTREEVLLKAGIKKASGVLAVLDSDPDNLFAVLSARELNPILKIIARIDNPTSEKRMLRAGADSVISPYVAAGKRVAESFIGKRELPLQGAAVDAGSLGPEWQEVGGTSFPAGRTVGELCDSNNIRILGIRRDETDRLLPRQDEKILVGDRLLVLSGGSAPDSSAEAGLNKKIVLVDDNPVITRLYTRLFQKAGFKVKTAATGAEGFGLIVKEKPEAAVVDLHLPDMSGLDVCRKLRGEAACDAMRLFLFTADERLETRTLAAEAGVDKVVVKSPESGEIVALVKQYLQ
jgi:voltage-gated potassium channel